MNEHAKKPFRIIIVGAGVTGLTASHALQKAGIDHVVLERGQNAAPPSGASIAMYPQGSRILDQIGCLKDTIAASVPLERLVNRLPDGSVVMENDYWKHVRENHGYELLLLERRKFLEILYENLPDKSRILFQKKVAKITESVYGVDVLLEDGTRESGDIVIGCDGVHSVVREMMWDNAAKIKPGLITVDEKKAIKTTWTCLLGMGPAEPALRSELSCVHNARYSFLIATQPDKTFYFVFFKVAKPYSSYSRRRWTAEDAENAATRLADHPISENVIFGELWKKRFRGQLVDVEEGVLKHWHFGRLVLVGDAAHKVTPNIALGGNSGMESVVSLVNKLNRVLKTHPSVKPTRAQLNTIFHTYQEERIPRMHKIMNFSRLITRVQAWDGILMKSVALYVLPWQNERKLGEQIGELIKGAPKFDFIPMSQYNKRRIRWDDEVRPAAKSKRENNTSLLRVQFTFLSAFFLALSSLMVMTKWNTSFSMALLAEAKSIGV